MKRLRVARRNGLSKSYKEEQVHAVATAAAILYANAPYHCTDEPEREQQKLYYIKDAQELVHLSQQAVAWGIEEYEEGQK